MKVRTTLENALVINGSSEKNLCQFITNMKAKIDKIMLQSNPLDVKDIYQFVLLWKQISNTCHQLIISN